jgi:hypothetical protein
MGLFDRFRRGQEDESVNLVRPQQDYEPDYSDVPYAGEFELPREASKLRAAWEHERAGGSFVIRKQYTSKGRASREIATLDRFPTYDDIVQAVEEMYGGGTYNVYAMQTNRLLKTYVVEGTSRALNLREAGRTKPATSKERLDDQGFRELDSLLQNEPELGRVLAGAILKKNFGVDLPGSLTYEDRLFQSELENNPEYRASYLEKALQNKGVKAKKPEEEPDDFDRLLMNLEKANKLRAAIGDKTESDDDSWRGIVKEAVKGAATYIQGGGRIPLPGGSSVPAIAQQQQPPPMASLQRPVEPPRLVEPPRPVEPPPLVPSEGRIIGRETLEPGSNGMSVSDDSYGAPIAIEGIDWTSLLPLVDWVELEGQTSGPPGEFAQAVYTRCYQDGSEPHSLLRDIFLTHSPQTIIATFSNLGETLQKPWVLAMAQFAGKMGDIEAAQRIIARLAGTPEGHHWVAEAVVAMQIIEERLLTSEAASGQFGDADIPGESGESGDVAGINMVHPGLNGVLGGGDDYDDENDVVR